MHGATLKNKLRNWRKCGGNTNNFRENVKQYVEMVWTCSTHGR